MADPKKRASQFPSTVPAPEKKEERDPESKEDPFNVWLKTVYETNLMSLEDLVSYYEAVKYHGFDRQEVLKQLFQKFSDPRKAAWVIILVAVRGPKAASITKMPDGTVLSQIGVPASGGQGTKMLTCNKIQAATADLAAFYLKRLGVPKRLDLELPGWLQFPSAGSIKLPVILREQHIQFHKQFSVAIGGQFNEAIYNQMQANAYLDPGLGLF
jgi:hypothetical protein